MESAASDFHCKMSMGNLLFMQTCPSSLASKIHIEIFLIELSLVHLGLKETDLFRPSNMGREGPGISVHVGAVCPGSGVAIVHFVFMAA